MKLINTYTLYLKLLLAMQPKLFINVTLEHKGHRIKIMSTTAHQRNQLVSYCKGLIRKIGYLDGVVGVTE